MKVMGANPGTTLDTFRLAFNLKINFFFTLSYHHNSTHTSAIAIQLALPSTNDALLNSLFQVANHYFR